MLGIKTVAESLGYSEDKLRLRGYHTVGDILSRMPGDKFDQIRHNENRALPALRDVMLG